MFLLCVLLLVVSSFCYRLISTPVTHPVVTLLVCFGHCQTEPCQYHYLYIVLCLPLLSGCCVFRQCCIFSILSDNYALLH